MLSTKQHFFIYKSSPALCKPAELYLDASVRTQFVAAEAIDALPVIYTIDLSVLADCIYRTTLETECATGAEFRNGFFHMPTFSQSF